MAAPFALKFAPISIEDLVGKIKLAVGSDPAGLLKALGSDIKVSFGTDNFVASAKGDGPRTLMGYHTLSNGLTFCGMCAGDDDQRPVFFIVYWDGEKLRGYVPEAGNPWNTEKKSAYGVYPESDAASMKKRWPNYTEEEGKKKSFPWYEDAAIQKDILAAVGKEEKPSLPQVAVVKVGQSLPVGALEKQVPRSTARKPIPLANKERRQISLTDEQPKKKKKPVKKKQEEYTPKTLEGRVTSLKFYGNEDYELFQSVCRLAHDLYVFGHAGKAEVAVSWAEELAYESKQFAEENRTLEDSLSGEGVWAA